MKICLDLSLMEYLDTNMIWLFTDGSSSKTFKSIGSGFAIFDKPVIGAEPIFKGNLGLKNVENIKTGASELIGILLGLDELINQNLYKERIFVYADSQYAINEIGMWFKNQLAKRFIDVKNTELLINILNQKIYFPSINFGWTKGHPKQIKTFLDWGNSIADELATSAHRADKGANPDELFSFNDFISDIDIQNKKENLFNKIYNYYIINDNL